MPRIGERLLSKGAEAYIYSVDWFGKPAVKKVRVKKMYRHPKLDERLRLQRTKREAKIMSDVKKLGIPAPTIYYFSPPEFTIIMEYIKGKILKEALLGNNLSEKSKVNVFKNIGEMTAIMHNNGIIHGDLTTSNIILLQDLSIVLIDFGLGEYTRSLEDFGIELRVFSNSLRSVHYKEYDLLFDAFLEGYNRNFDMGNIVYKKFEEISKRGRYVEERRLRKFAP
ncbi:MAG: KEOPS complex kinase/ATPase Bud32 [Candidatus Njordarchaeia archaeon]